MFEKDIDAYTEAVVEPGEPAKGVSQAELANRLGVSKQVISRYEESDYQTVAISRLQEILDAIGITTIVTLRA